MTDVEIRPLGPDDDMDAQIDLGQRAFGPMTERQRENWAYVGWLLVRQGLFLGAFAAGRPVGAAVVHDMRQWWHGRALPCAGVASVKVAPEHRGEGIGRRLMVALLDLIAERGYPVSALYPATMPLYRSLGWELAGGHYQAVVPARSLRALLAPDAHAVPSGEFEVVGQPEVPRLRRAGPGDAAAVTEVIGRCHETARDCGPLTRDLDFAARWLAREDMYAYLTDDGFASYGWHGGDDELFVERVHGASPAALRSLWSVIASHSSVARTVRLVTGPADPFWWLLREHDATITDRSMWMLRLVDAPTAIERRGFPASVSLTTPLIINDHIRPANSGRWELTVGDGKGTLIPNGPGVHQPATATADPVGASPGGSRGPLTLGARGLAALYAGTPVATLRLSGLASGGSPDADTAIDAAFAATPYTLDDF
jgi:GNAT superfamily N-acetyltransferase